MSTAPKPVPDAGPRTDTGDYPVLKDLAGIRDLAHSVDRYRQSLGAEHGIGVPEVVTLAHLAATTDPVRASEVAERTGLTQASVTALLDRLERRGFTRRVRPPENRRIVVIELTDTGRELALGMYAPVLPMLAAAAAEPDAPDPRRMAHCLSRIAAMMAHLADHPDARNAP